MRPRIGQLRFWTALATVIVLVIGAAIVIAAYAGWDLGLSTHDKSATVTVALTFDALLFGAVAAVLAQLAYWSASGLPLLSIEISFGFCEINRPRFWVKPARESDGWLEVRSSKQCEASVLIVNRSKYAAHNAGVRIRVIDIMTTGSPTGWPETVMGDMTGLMEYQWDAPAGQLIHGSSARHLPDFALRGAFIQPQSEPRFEVTLFADGMTSKPITLPIRYEVGTGLQPDSGPEVPLPTAQGSGLSISGSRRVRPAPAWIRRLIRPDESDD